VPAQDGERAEAAHERLAIAGLLRRDPSADQGRPRGGEGLGQVRDLRDGKTGHLSSGLESPGRDHPAIGIQVLYPQAREIEIGSAGFQQMPADGRREDRVGARHRRQMDVAHLRRAG
jgi:hypothetical protein